MEISRSALRETAFILLFEYLVKGNETAQEIWDNAVELPTLKTADYVTNVYFGSAEQKEKIDELVDKCLVGWSGKRVSYVSRTLLTLATYEMMNLKDVPYRVAINEAIKLSKKYEGGDAYTFINGVLNAVAEDLGLKVENDE